MGTCREVDTRCVGGGVGGGRMGILINFIGLVFGWLGLNNEDCLSHRLMRCTALLSRHHFGEISKIYIQLILPSPFQKVNG